MRKSALIFILLLCAVAVWADITIDGTPDAFTEAAADTVHTSAALTVANNTNRLLVVPFGMVGNVSVVSVEFNSVGASVVSACSIDSGFSANGKVYTLINPDAATDDVTITIGVSARLLQMPISLYGAAQTNPIRDGDAESGSTATSTADLTLTTVVGDWVGSCIMVRRDAGVDPGAGLAPDDGTQLEELYNSLGTRFSCSWRVAAGTSTTVGWAGWTASNGWVHVAFAVAPATPGAAIHYYNQMRQQ